MNRDKKFCKIGLIFLILSFLWSEISFPQVILPIQEYLGFVQQKIYSCLIYPKKAINKGWEGSVKVIFLLNQDGWIKEIDIAKSSGYTLLDAAALLAVKDASPYPSFEPYTEKEELQLQITLTFKSKDEAPVQPKPAPEKPVTVKKPPAPEKLPTLEKPVNLEEFIEIAIKNNQPAKIAKQQKELAQLKFNKAKRDIFPALAGEYKTTEGKTITDPYEAKSYGLQAEQVLFDSGKLFLTSRREKLGLRIAQKNYEQIKNELTFKVRKTYYEFAGAKRVLENLEETLEEVKKDLGLVKKQYELGLVTEVELLSAQSKYERMQYFIDSTKADLSLAKLNFQQTLNVESIEAYEPKVSLDLEVKEIKIDLEQASKIAQKERPDIQGLELSKLSSKYTQTIAQRENRPKLSLVSSVGSSGEAYSNQRLDMTNEWSIMGKVSWLFGGSTVEDSLTRDRVLPKNITDTTLKSEATTYSTKFSLLNNLNYYSERKEAEIAHKQVLNELNELKQKAASEIKEAYLSYQKALSQLNSSLSEKNFRNKELGVSIMRRNIAELPTSEVMQARIEVAQANSTYTQAVANHHLSIAALNKAMGRTDYY